MIVNVLGSEYKVETRSEEKDKCLNDCNGYCDRFQRLIVVIDLDTCDLWKNEPKETKLYERNRILRHEIIHAFLHESGLIHNSLTAQSWSTNEEMVDWIAIQFPKISEVYKILGIM